MFILSRYQHPGPGHLSSDSLAICSTVEPVLSSTVLNGHPSPVIFLSRYQHPWASFFRRPRSCKSTTFKGSSFQPHSWNSVCTILPPNSFSILSSFKRHIKETYRDLCVTRFEVDMPCTWSLVRDSVPAIAHSPCNISHCTFYLYSLSMYV